MNVFELRPSVPETWPASIREWAEERLRHHTVPIPIRGFDLYPELCSDLALQWWLPMRYLIWADGTRVDPHEGSIVLAWPDGSTHIGAPPRSPDDLVPLYLASRICLEHAYGRGAAAGCRDALAGLVLQ